MNAMNAKIEIDNIIFRIDINEDRKKISFHDESESVSFVINDDTRFLKKSEDEIVLIENDVECQILFGEGEVTVSVNYVPIVYGGGDFTRVKELLKLL